MINTSDEGEPETPQIPAQTCLAKLFPNPFNPTLYISYKLVKASPVKINIFNSRGQLIRSFDDLSPEAGTYNLPWDGKDQSGSPCGSGMYFVRMIAGNEVFSQKAMLLK
jgi:hypothetical protein